MPYKKKAPARKKKFIGGALSTVAKRTKRKTSGLSEAQKRLLGSAQAGALQRGAGAISKQLVDYTRKHGDQRKAASAPAKRKTGSTASSKRAAAMMALGNKQRAAAAKGKKKTSTARGVASRGRSIRAKTPAERMGGQLAQQKRTRTRTAPSTTKQRGRMTPAQRQAAQRRIAAMRRRARRPAVGSGRGGMTLAQRRAARLEAARKRAYYAARRRKERKIGQGRRLPVLTNPRIPGREYADTPRKRRAPATYRRPSAPNRKPVTSRRRRAAGGLATMLGRGAKRTRTVNPIRAAYTGIKTAPVGGHGNKFVNLFRSSMINSKEL